MNLGLLGFPKRAYPPGLVFLGKRKFNNNALHSFVRELSPDIDEYEMVFNNLVQSVSTTLANFQVRFSTDRGAAWDSSNNYVYSAWTWTHAVTAPFGGAPTSAIYIGAADNDAGYGMCSRAQLFLNNRQLYTQFLTHNFARDNNRGANDPQGTVIGGAYRSTKRVTGIQFGMYQTGVVVSGEVLLYGYSKGV